MRRELLTTVVGLLLAAPAMAGTCGLDAQISPANQSVSEKDSSGVPTLVMLNGQPSSKDATAYLWEQIAGPLVTLNNPTAAKPTFSAPEVGPSGATLTFKLTVSGCSPLQQKSATTSVNVANVVTNRPPVASATFAPSAVYEGTLVTLDGSSSSDPDSNPLTYTWSQLTGPAVTLTADGAKATFTAPAEVPFPNGTSLSFQLTVSDGSLKSSTDQIVNVLWVNDPPTAALSCPESVNEGSQITLDGSGSTDSDNGIASYQWSQALGTPNATLPNYDMATATTLSFAAPHLDSVNDTMTFKLLVTDAGSLSDSKQCSVKVLDVTAPAIGDGPGNLTAEATSAAGAEVTFTAPTATDNVDGVIAVSCTPASGATFPLGTSTVTCSVADAAQNGASKEFSVKVQDTTAPAVTPPAPVTAEATGPRTEVAIGSATATDAVGVKAITSDAPANYPVGATIVTWSASDNAGNIGTATQSVTVQDTTAPVVTPPAAVVAEATAPLSAVEIGTATAVDAVGVKSIGSNAPAVYPVGTTEVTWSASDEAGNIGTATQSVTVQDTTAPVVTAPAAVVVEATAAQSPVAIGTATATDAVGVKSIDNNAPALYPVGTTVVTWTAKDAAGNTGIATQSITVKDTTAPAVTPPAAVTVEATGPNTTVATGSANASDAVGVTSLASDAPASFPVGTTVVTWTAKDAAGNTGTATQSITVKDTTAPKLDGVPKGLTVVIGQAATYEPTATDLVDGSVPVTCTPGTGSSFALGTTTVTCSAKDAHGNGTSAKFDVNVQYGFNGLLAPYDANKAYKIKSAIPLKWQFTNSTGSVIASASAQPSVSIQLVSNGVASSDLVTLDDAGSSGLQYDSVTNTWQFNWKTTGYTDGTYNIYIQSGITGQKIGPFPVRLAK
ncbi:HYR domain-containing protein [Geomonas azotofigens]|uniref:HYR domain-containing protein n=1 Tax=Geomonas azotofigens TaxID=2843196 RepID=UPI001C10A087|nr:HYR domain-containing protein [Geomonas azotofigens]MBU5612619.1 HYR domain-containing protein [Geomonas azotofigens]